MRYDSPSLNECLYRGPALNPTIFNVLLRFRDKRIALVGDIEKAFLSVGIAEKDRDVPGLSGWTVYKTRIPDWCFIFFVVWCLESMLTLFF